MSRMVFHEGRLVKTDDGIPAEIEQDVDEYDELDPPAWMRILAWGGGLVVLSLLLFLVLECFVLLGIKIAEWVL